MFLGFCLQLVASFKVECGVNQPGSGYVLTDQEMMPVFSNILDYLSYLIFEAIFCQVEGLLNNGPGYSSLLGKISDFR